MSKLDFRGINLNLIPALEALLHEGAVGRAARRMGVSQSAMSHSLARLREALGDPLLLPQGRGMTLSPRARKLAEELPAALEQLQGVLSGPEAFDPATDSTTFRIATVDYFELTTMPGLLTHLAAQAPSIRLQIERFTQDSFAALEEGELDLVLGGGNVPRRAGIRTRELYRDTFKVIARAEHPGIGRRLTLDTYLGHDHVLVRFEGRGPGVVDRVLAKQGRERRVGLWVPHFISAPLAVVASDMISTLPIRVALRARELFGVRLLEPPIELPTAPVTMSWPRSHDTDAPSDYLRQIMIRWHAKPLTLAAVTRKRSATRSG